MRRHLLPAALLVLAVLCGASAARLDDDGRAGAAGAIRSPATTPVLSVRRLPGYVSRVAAEDRLRTALDRVMDDRGLVPDPSQACLVVHDAGGNELYARGAEVELLPASTIKLVTAAVVLDKLGLETRLPTDVRASAQPAGGVLAGDLWVVGGGDPLLATAEFASEAGYKGQPRAATSLEELADRIAGAGIRQVQGRLIGDESRYDTQRYVPTWRPSYVSEGQSGPMSALTVNNGLLRIKPRPEPSPAPATHAVDTLTLLLAQRGVSVGGTAEGKVPPDTVPVTSIDSLPVRDLVGEMLQESDNLAAELLVKELGVRFGGGGSTEAGLAVLRSSVAAMGLPTDELVAADGSGLDRGDRVSCALLVAVLGRVGAASPLANALPVAGANGTLRRRLVGSPATGRVRAKTGTLRDVGGMSGWVDDAQGQRLGFALIMNGLPGPETGVPAEDTVANILVSFPAGPPPAELGPPGAA